LGLGLFHAFEQRQFALVIKVNTHAQIHFFGVGIGCELLVQTQDGVTGGHFNGVKQGHVGLVVDGSDEGGTLRSGWDTLVG
jgi:hypothetical protein